MNPAKEIKESRACSIVGLNLGPTNLTSPSPTIHRITCVHVYHPPSSDVAQAEAGDRPPILPVSTLIKHVTAENKKIKHILTLFSLCFLLLETIQNTFA